MNALLTVTDCMNETTPIDKHLSNNTKQYFLKVMDVDWNYAPSSMNKFHGGSLTAAGTYVLHYENMPIQIT